MGCWDPSHPSTPRRCSLDSNHRSPAASCGRGSSKRQHLALWQAEQAAAPTTLELPPGLSRGEAADGPSGLLHPCLSYVCFWCKKVQKSPYRSPLLVVSTRSCSSMRCITVKRVYFPVPAPKVPQIEPRLTPMQKDDQNQSSCEFKAATQDAVLAKTCLTF